jgi:hypothetical protein
MNALKAWLHQLWKYRVLAILGFLASCVPLLLMYLVSPKDIQDVWVPNTYAPLILSVWFAAVLWGIWFFADVRRGILISVGATLLFWWQLLGLLTPTSIGVMVGIVLIQEMLFQLGDLGLARMVQSRGATRPPHQISHHRHPVH